MSEQSVPRRRIKTLVLAVLFGLFAALTAITAYVELAPAIAQTEGRVPGGTLGTTSDAELWRQVRRGVTGTVSIPDQKAATLVQSEGDNWRAWRNGPIYTAGAAAFWTIFLVVFGFYMLRGKVRIQHGKSGRTILRFNGVERFAHWLAAGSFIVLAVTGVNMLYGKHLLMPVIGKEAFAALTELGKLTHNYVGFAFMLGLVMIFVLWVKDNFWDRYDWGWIKKGGGLLFETEHPRAGKFNFGQKTVFWMVIGGGLVLSGTGLNLLFPFQWATLSQMQWLQAIHGTASQVMCMLMIAHIYIGSIGMEDAIHSMTSGRVDENWAREHHAAWFDEVKAKEAEARRQAPAAAPGAPAE